MRRNIDDWIDRPVGGWAGRAVRRAGRHKRGHRRAGTWIGTETETEIGMDTETSKGRGRDER